MYNNYEELRRRAQQLTREELDDVHEKVGYSDSRGYAITGFAYPLDNPLFYVKDGHRDSIVPESKAQQFAYDSLEALPAESRKGIHVPRIIRVIVEPTGAAFIVMEYIQGRTLNQIISDDVEYEDFPKFYSAYFDKVARGLKLFLSFPIPSLQTKPGPLGGRGQAKHPFFQKLRSPHRV